MRKPCTRYFSFYKKHVDSIFSFTTFQWYGSFDNLEHFSSEKRVLFFRPYIFTSVLSRYYGSFISLESLSNKLLLWRNHFFYKTRRILKQRMIKRFRTLRYSESQKSEKVNLSHWGFIFITITLNTIFYSFEVRTFSYMLVQKFGKYCWNETLIEMKSLRKLNIC